MPLHIVHERRSDANTSVAAIDTMAGRGSARKGAVVHDAKDFLDHLADALEVVWLICDFNHPVLTPRVNQVSPTHRQAEMLPNQEGVDSRLEPEGRVNPAGVLGELVIERASRSIGEEEHLVDPASEMMARTRQAHVNPLFGHSQPLPQIRSVSRF